MLIQTQHDARVALEQLAIDLGHTTTTQIPQIGVADGGLFGFLGINSPGSLETQNAAIDLVNQLSVYVQDFYATLDDSETPLTSYQVAKMKLIQSQVVDARSTVQSTISDLDWSFGQFVADSLAAARNIADQAVQKGASVLGLSWPTVQVLGVVVGGVVLYAVYRRVLGK